MPGIAAANVALTDDSDIPTEQGEGILGPTR